MEYGYDCHELFVILIAYPDFIRHNLLLVAPFFLSY